MPRWASIAGLRELARRCRRLVATRPFRWFLIVCGAALLVGTFIGILVVLPNLMAPAQGEDRFSQVNEARKTVAQIVGGFILLLAGLSTAWLTMRRVNAIERQVALAAEGQVTDRLSRGIEQLGATSNSGSTPEIRAGGVFTLERVAKESEASFDPVFQILMGYLRTHSPRSDDTDPPGRDSLRMDVEAALSALERLAPLPLRQAVIVLPRVHFPGAAFSNIDLSFADLRRASLIGAGFNGTNLRGAYLGGADVSWANLRGADLSHSHLMQADFSGADLTGANLNGAWAAGAYFGGAELNGAALNGTRLANAYLQGAHLAGATLNGAYLTEANLAEADLSGTDLRGAGLTRADLTGANLTAADLDGAYLGQVIWDSTTLWPAGFDPPPSAPRRT